MPTGPGSRPIFSCSHPSEQCYGGRICEEIANGNDFFMKAHCARPCEGRARRMQPIVDHIQITVRDICGHWGCNRHAARISGNRKRRRHLTWPPKITQGDSVVRLRYLVAPVLSFLLLIGCASAPKLSSIKGALPPLSSDQARIYFYRAYRFGEAYQPEVTVNGEVVGKAQMEGVFFRDYPPATYKISTSMAQGKHLVLDLAAGETKYVRLTYRIGFNVYPELVDRATGEAESEGLSYTGVMFPTQGFTPAYVAEEPKDGPRALFKDPFIENLSGEWDITRTTRGKVVHNKASAAWVLNHQFLQLHMTDVSSPPAY